MTEAWHSELLVVSRGGAASNGKMSLATRQSKQEECAAQVRVHPKVWSGLAKTERGLEPALRAERCESILREQRRKAVPGSSGWAASSLRASQ